MKKFIYLFITCLLFHTIVFAGYNEVYIADIQYDWINKYELEKEEIITYRSEEHDLLMSIRNGEYLDENRQPRSEFYDLLNEYEKRFDYAKNNTSLPDEPDHKRINEFKMYVNERIIRGDI